MMDESPNGFPPTGRWGPWWGQLRERAGPFTTLICILPHSWPDANESTARCARTGSWRTYGEWWVGENEKVVLLREQHVSTFSRSRKESILLLDRSSLGRDFHSWNGKPSPRSLPLRNLPDFILDPDRDQRQDRLDWQLYSTSPGPTVPREVSTAATKLAGCVKSSSLCHQVGRSHI